MVTELANRCSLVAPPGERDERSDDDGWQDRQRAEEQHRCHNLRFFTAELRQRADEPELGDSDPARSQWQCSE
jgi:hypothetical protein